MPTLREHVIMDHVDEVKKLLNKDNINQKAGPWTLLHQTVFSNLPRMTECLCELGADVNAKGGDNETPLHVASTRKRIEVARVLLAYGADIHAKDSNGTTPLDYAKSEKDDEMSALFQKPPARKSAAPASKDNKPARVSVERVQTRLGLTDIVVIGSEPERPAVKSTTSFWNRLWHPFALSYYARKIAAKVRDNQPHRACGLYDHEPYLKRLGEEIHARYGLQGMHDVFNLVHKRQGSRVTSELGRIWRNVGDWSY